MAVTFLTDKDKSVLDQQIAALTEEMDALKDNLFDTDESIEKIDLSEFEKIPNKFIGWDGTVSDFDAIDYYLIPVKEGERYYITNRYVSAIALYVLLDSNKNFVSGFPAGNPPAQTDVTDYEVVIPAGVGYMAVNDITRWHNVTVEVKKEVNEHTIKGEHIGFINNLNGKKLAVCGDSITEAINPDGGYFVNYAELVAERNYMNVYKDGIGGSTMTNVEGKHPFSVERYLNVPEYDYLLLWFGWNDGAYAQLGTIDDTDNTTFYGAYKMVLNHFITTYPTKKIGLIVPYGNIPGYQQAVRDLSKMYGVPCLDLPNGNDCSLIWGVANEAQLARRAALTYDGTHPNQAGYEYLSTMVEAFLRRL